MAQSIFEKNGGKYIKVGDYYVPDLGQFDEDTEPVDERVIGKYGSLRRTFLEEHRPAIYTKLLYSFELDTHLKDVNVEAQNLIDKLLPQYKKQQGVTEELKAQNQLLWVGKVNNIIAQIEEIIYREIVYV